MKYTDGSLFLIEIVLIIKTGECVTKKVKSIDFDSIHKFCSFKQKTGFSRIHTWRIKNKHFIHLYGKSSGRSNNINKFELPPPVDKDLYYGTMCLIRSTTKKESEDDVVNYKASDWNNDYEALMGGFEDLNDEDSYESDELENYPKECITKEGYLKDGFIVSNDEDVDDNNV